jgi:hypothetical protein
MFNFFKLAAEKAREKTEEVERLKALQDSMRTEEGFKALQKKVSSAEKAEKKFSAKAEKDRAKHDIWHDKYIIGGAQQKPPKKK